MRVFRVGVLCVVLVCAVYAVGYAQTAPPAPATDPEPYEEEEFPPWLRSLRRFEIILVDSFPLTYLVTFLVYDIVRFAIESANIGAVNPLYAPLFFAPANKPPPSREETIALIVTAVGVSLVVAIIDLVIQEKKRERIAERARIEEVIRRDERISRAGDDGRDY